MKCLRWRLINMQPKTKTQEAYEFLQNYQGLTNPNGLMSYRCKRWLEDSQSLIHNDPVDGYMLQGFVYTLLGDNELAIKSLRKAKNLNNYLGKVNYAFLLVRSGKFDEGLHNSLNLLRQNPTDKSVLSIVLEGARFTLNTDLVEQAFELYKGDDDNLLSTSFNYIDENIKLLQSLNIDKDNFIYITKMLVNFLVSRYFGNYSIEMHIAESEIGKKLDLNVYLHNVSIEHCLEFNDLFLDMLIDDSLKFDDYKDIFVHFVPMEYRQVA